MRRKSHHVRLAAIEGALPSASPPTEEELRYESALKDILETMDPDHVLLVLGHLQESEDDPGAARLYAEVTRRASKAASTDGSDGPLALPSKVSDVYLRDADARNLHACEDCGYGVPVHCGAPIFGPFGPKWRKGIPSCRECLSRNSVDGSPPCGFIAYFPRCPLCGGRTRHPWAR